PRSTLFPYTTLFRSIRTALGATRIRIIRQVITEAMLLALAGAAVGVLLAAWGVPLLVSLASTSLPRLHNVGINLQVLATTVGARSEEHTSELQSRSD